MSQERPLYTLYKNLKAQNYDVPDDYDRFESALTRNGKEGADNRHAIYQNLKAQNFDIPDNYERFYSALFEPRSKDSSRAKGGFVPMSNSDKARFYMGAQGFRMNTPSSGDALRYNKMKQRQDKRKKDFGRVSIGTDRTPFSKENNVVKDEGTGAYITSDNDTTNNIVEAQQNQGALDEYGKAYQEAVNRGDMPSVFDVRDKNGNYDLQENIGKDGTHVTDEGAQAQFERKLADAYARKKEIEDAIAEEHRQNGNPLLSYTATFGGGNGRTHEQQKYLTDLIASRALVDKQIGALEAVKQYGEGSSVWKDAWKAMDNTAFNANTWDFGITDFATMGRMEGIKAKLDNNLPLTSSERTLLNSKLGSDAAAAMEDEKMGNVYRWTKIAGQSLPFMADFFLTGGYGGITKAASRGALKFAAKRGMGKISAAVLKNTGVVLGDVIGSYAMAGTEQAMKTGADIMQRHMGNLYQDEQGNYAFGTFDENGNLLHEGGESFGTALYKGMTAAMIENYTEKIFGHNYGFKKGAIKFMENHGMSKSADFFKNIGSKEWYAGSKKWMEKVGINGFGEEVMEEEIGIPLNALLVGDNKTSDLLDAKQQLDIIGGMAISVGSMYAMGVIKGIYNRGQYYKFKHKMDVADGNAQQVLGDKWADLKDKIDNTPNEKMGGALYSILQSRDSMTKEQINSAIDYGVNLMKMRGYNLGTTIQMNAKEMTGEQDTPEEEKNNEIDNAYSEGHDAEGADTHDIQIDQADKQKSLAELLGITEEQLSQMDDEQLEFLTGQDDKIDNAIYEYQLSNAKYQGVIDNANDQVDMAAQQAARQVDLYTDKSRGTVRNATIKATQGAEDYGVYIISGNLATHDDGAIDISNSDNMIIYFDPKTGTIEHADANRFAALGEEKNADEVKDNAVQIAKEEAIKKLSGIIDGRVDVGTQFTVTDEQGNEHTYEVLADNGDGTAMITIDGNVPTELVKGETVQIPYSFEDLQNMKNVEDAKRLAIAKEERARLEAERNQQNQETEQPKVEDNLDYSKIADKNGNVVQVEVEDKDGNPMYPDAKDIFLVEDEGYRSKVIVLDNEGNLTPYSVKKNNVRKINEVSLDEYRQLRQEELGVSADDSSVVEGESGASVEEPVSEVQEGNSDVAPAEEEQAPAMTLEDGTVVPLLDDGNPDFSQLTAEQTAELYDSQFGEDAEQVIGGWVSEAKNALEKANKMTIKGKNFVEQKASKAAKDKAIADAQARYDSITSIANAYNVRLLAKEEGTPEGRKNLLDKAKAKYNRLKGKAENVQALWSDTVGKVLHRLYDGLGVNVFDHEPQTVEEYVSSSITPYSLNYEGTETSKGVKQETGLERKDFAKSHVLAAEGKGVTVDNFVHKLWDNRPSQFENVSDQDIRNALIGLIMSDMNAYDMQHIIENNRIAQAEKEIEDEKRAAENASVATPSVNAPEVTSEETPEETSVEVPADATDEKPLGEQKDESELPFSAKDEAKQETSEERAANVEKNKVDDVKVVDNIVGKKTRKALERIAKMMGARIQWQYSDKIGNGWYDSSTNTVYLTLDSSITEGVQFIFGHEMTHEIKTKNPAAFEELTQLVKNGYGEDFEKAVDAMQKRYSDAGLSGYDRGYYEEEVIADGIGELMRDLNLAHGIALKMSHPLLAKIHEILMRIRMAFTGTEYRPTVENIIRTIEQAYVKTANQETMSLEGEPKFSLKVYHGSGADFTEFDFDHMGEGEGSQAFGWGGYVTSSKKIGKSYADMGFSNASARSFTFKETKEIDERIKGETSFKNISIDDRKRLITEAEQYLREGFDDYRGTTPKEIISFVVDDAETAGASKEVVDILKSINVEDLYLGERNLYEVNIPDDNGSNYLDWYGRNSNIPQQMLANLSDELEREGWKRKDLPSMMRFTDSYDNIVINPNATGADLYEELKEAFKSPKEASEILSRAGFTGIKYPAGTIQGGAEEGDINYVIFKPEDMKIVDHTKFSLKNNQNDFSSRLKSAIAETETNPSDAQKESGNYKKGHIKFGGYDYTIENPKGSTRSGKDADGKPWSITMHDTYGYIRGKFGKDGDHLDMFINDGADLDSWNGDVYVVDQVNTDGSFDEHKVMYGYDTMDDAKKAYLSNYSEGWQGLGNITGASKEEFDKWLDTSKRKLKPFADYAKVKFSQAQSEENNEKFSLKTDNQGNPLNADGTLKLDKVKSVDELTDEDFLRPVRNVQMPTLPKKVADAIGIDDKPVIIKKNIFERNYMRHKDVTPKQSKAIFKAALYNPDLYGQNQKKQRPYNWVLINTKDEQGKNRTVLLEVNPNKDNVEIVHWYFVNDKNLELIKKQAIREGDQILILPSEQSEEVGGLSNLTDGLSAAKIDNSSETSKRNGEKFSLKDKEYDFYANRFDIDAEDIAKFDEAMQTSNVQLGHWAMANIRRTYRLNRSDMSLSMFAKMFNSVKNELYSRYGNLDELQKQYEDNVMAERNVMEAAHKKAEEEKAEKQKHLDELSLISDADLDKRYMDALANNDEATAREMLDESARRKGYGDSNNEYQGQGAWVAPSNPHYESDEARRADVEANSPDVNLEDMALGYNLQPSDYFYNPRDYTNDTAHGLESSRVIRNALDALKRGEKDVKVKVYRAVPTSVKEGKLRNGDWVTPSKKYAEMHGNNRLEGKYRIIEDEVPANQLWWDGNDANEFGFDDGKEYKYKNAKNNRKLNDLITRDDKGNIIPPSKRFNSRKSDVRFSLAGERGAANMDKAEEVTTRLDNLAVARQMEEAKKDAKAIKMATGWERGADGKWRYEIPDISFNAKGNANFNKIQSSQPWAKELEELTDRIFNEEQLSNKELKRFEELADMSDDLRANYENSDVKYLDDYAPSDVLYKAYPQLRQVKVQFVNRPSRNFQGSFSDKENTICLNENSDLPLRSALAHEIQHAIQHIEGFANGGNPESVRSQIQRIIDEEQDASDYAKEQLKQYATLHMLAASLSVYKELVKSDQQYFKDKAQEYYWDAMNALDNDEGSKLVNEYPDNKTAKEIAESGYHVDEAIKELKRLGDEYKDGIPKGNMDALDEVSKLTSALEGKTDYELYRALVGEVEARNVEKRLGMTDEERRNTLAAETEDVAREDQIFLGVDEPKYSIRTYHGTGANFDAFDSSHALEGEGSESFGHGVYVTSSNAIGADYAKRAKKTHTSYIFTNRMKPNNDTEKNLFKSFSEYYHEDMDFKRAKIDVLDEVDDSIKYFSSLVDGYNKRGVSSDADKKEKERLEKLIDEYKAARPRMEAVKVSDLKGIKANRYDVEIPDDNGKNYLKWRGLVPQQQLDVIGKALEGMGMTRENVKDGVNRYSDGDKTIVVRYGMNGATLYQALSNNLGGDKNASKILSDSGIVGMKYRAGMIHGGAKEGDYNYVIYKDSDAKIVGVTKFSLKKVNDDFNEQLDKYVNGKMSINEMLHLGKPSGVMVSFLPDLPIVMRTRILNKASNTKHNVEVGDLKDLPMQISEPIFVFKRSDNALGVLTEIKDRDGLNVCVAIELGKTIQNGGDFLEVNDIRSIHGRNAVNLIEPIIHNNTLVYADKEKGLAWLSSASYNYQQEIDKQDLSTAAKIVKDFENPNISGEKMQKEPKFSLRVDQYQHDLAQWKKDNGLSKDAERPSIPIREPNESSADFMRRIREYRKQTALWKTAPKYEQHLLTSGTAQGQFNLELQRGSVLARIALQDSMLPIRKAQEAIMKEVGVNNLNIAEDAYTAENRSHGKGKNEFEEYNNEFLQPLRKSYHKMMKNLDNSYDNVKVYMMAKHGLERNAHMAFKKSLDEDYKKPKERIAAYNAYKVDMDRMANDADWENGKIDFTTWRQRDNAIRTKYAPSYLDYRYDTMGITQDYSGLSALFDGSDFEEAAADLVKDVEGKFGSDANELWNNTNAATKKILRDSYKAEMMSKEVYEYVRGMYSHYIPLRGWGDTNADQVWNYMGGGKGAFNQTLKVAKGRGSLADDPIAYIENMAESGILINNKNWVKRHLLLLAENHPTSLLNLSKAWYIKSKDAQGNEEWIPASPNITANMTSKQVEAELDAFQQRMEKLQEKGDATQKREHLEISYPQTNSEEREHEVRVMKGGEEYVIYINGDPQLAQAMNNTRAIRVRQGLENSISQKAIATLGRKMAAAYTSLSPLFIPSNFFRDFTMTLASTVIREDARYNYLLRKNMLTHWNMYGMVRSYQSGKLREKVRDGKASKTEQMFYDFMMNGGETGFVSSLDVEDLKKKLKNELKDMNRMALNPKKVWHVIMEEIETLNRVIEDSNRFMVYMTSIEYGRSIDEAVNDAKDVTLNFNRKGTGEHSWQTIRNLYLFINPAIQSLQTLGALAKHHPFKFTAVTTAWMASGLLVPMINNSIMSLFGGDDDKDKYWSFTKWDRRNNLIMWVGNGNFVKIPLAQEFRGFYGVGDMIASKMMGGEKAEQSWEDYGWDMLGQVVDMLPLDPTGYDGNIAVSLMPNPIRPMFELAFNVDFTGKPLFKDSEYNKYDPNFTKAYAGTPDWLVRISKMVNSVGNDYPDYQQNAIDKIGDPRFNLNNPAVLDHVLSSYLGGAYTLGSQILGYATKKLNGDETKIADVPFVSKFVGNPDDRPVSKKQGDDFWTTKERHDIAANTLSKLKKKAKVDGDYSTLDTFFGSDEYKQYKLDNKVVKKYEEDKKKERAEETGEEYKPHKTTYEDIYKAHTTPSDDFEDMIMEQIYPKVNGIKKSWEALADMASSQASSFFEQNADAINAAESVADIRSEINDIKKGFLSDDGKETFSADGMSEIRALRKEALAVLEKSNKVIVEQQKARAKSKKK